MEWIYEEWNKWLEAALKAISDLMELFHLLLLKTGGDVEEALQWMEHLQEQGYISADVDLQKFREALENQQIVTMTEQGPSLSSRGERN